MDPGSETLSDCSASSCQSSSLSDLSVYGAEFAELKHTLKRPTQNCKLNHNSQSPQHHDKYTKEMCDWRVSYNDQVEKLLKHNHHLESRLKSAHDHVHRLINTYNCRESPVLLEEKNVALEKCNHMLNLDISRLSTELVQCKDDKNHLENECSNLKIQVKELGLDLSAKQECIAKLKDKVLEQHVEFEKLSKHNTSLARIIDSKSRELDQVKKSENWYRTQLTHSQTEKINLKHEMVEQHKATIKQEQKLGHLHLEINQWKCKCDALYLTLLKEKEKEKNTEPSLNKSTDIDTIVRSYEHSIQEMANEITQIKLNYQHQHDFVNELSKQNREMAVKCCSLETSLKEKQNLNETLAREVHQLKSDLASAVRQGAECKGKLVQLTDTNIQLRTELDTKITENCRVEESIKTVREQFRVFRNKYDRLRAELSAKERLQGENDQLGSVLSVKEITKLAHNYVNSHPDNVNVAHDILDYICTLGKVDDYHLSVLRGGGNKNDKDSDKANVLIHGTDKFFVGATAKSKDNVVVIEKKVIKLRNIVEKMNVLEQRCRVLERKTEESETVLLRLLKEGSADEEVKHVRALLAVKIREQKDREKRYETNHRTLLRKVKEHMRGRNVAEKHTLHLQELYNGLSEECNSLKLQMHLKESNSCQQCGEFELVKQQKQDLVHSLTICERFKKRLLQEAELSANLVRNLQEKVSSMDREYQDSLLQATSSLGEKLETELVQERQNVVNANTENKFLKKEIETLTHHNAYLVKELESINASVHQKDEELQEVTVRSEQLKKFWIKQDKHTQNIITALKAQLQMFKNEADRIQSDKFFLQRLCNDLKIALQVHVDHNKILKEYITGCVNEEKEKWTHALQVAAVLPYPGKYEDGNIERLLHANKAPVEETPLSEIQEGLDTLRKEISALQQQIIEKNVS